MGCNHTGDNREGRSGARPQDDRPPKPKAESKLAGAVRSWLAEVLPGLLPALPRLAGLEGGLAACTDMLVQQAPRRWVVYEPMVLLATGSFGFQAVASAFPSPSSDASAGPWQMLLAAATLEQQAALWRGVLVALSPGGGGKTKGSPPQLTHLAVNEGIPPRVSGTSADEAAAAAAAADETGTPENILRSPAGLRVLYGDFGPTAVADDEAGPTDADFAAAFWVSTRQNGLYQTWAPRWSMFSRGNIKEKARLLAWEDAPDTQDTQDTQDTAEPAWAVDVYAGIGYFVFSYAQRGLRVLGWELNPWSAEALRRGALRNGWAVRVVRGGAEAEAVVASAAGAVGSLPRIVVFVEDNAHAARRIAALRPRVVHSNCGLLPTSRGSWRTAWDAVVGGAGGGQQRRRPGTGWLHLHENVGAADIEPRRAALQALVADWAAETDAAAGGRLDAEVQHVELVKTFAPGVWHCVFDVCISMR